MATGNSPSRVPAACRRRAGRRAVGHGAATRAGGPLAAFAGLIALCGVAFVPHAKAAERPPQHFADGAEQRFEEARARFQADTNDTTRAWQLGRAAFRWADFARDNRQRETIATEGIAACRWALKGNDELAAAHYYLGMNCGRLAQARKLEALGLVKEMERCLLTARQLQETLEFAGPDRSLGLLYWRAPGWPTSVGSRSKARRHLERAAKLGAEYPENRLNLMEALLQWKDAERLGAEVTAYSELLPRAREAFAGVGWEEDWFGWDQRWELLRKEIERRKK